MLMDKQINHDNHCDESKTRTRIFSKLPDDGDPFAPNNLLKSGAKEKLVGWPTNIAMKHSLKQHCSDAFIAMMQCIKRSKVNTIRCNFKIMFAYMTLLYAKTSDIENHSSNISYI